MIYQRAPCDIHRKQKVLWARRAGLSCKYVRALLHDVALHLAVCPGTS